MINFNSNNFALEAAINLLRHSDRSAIIQKDFNQKRINRIEKAVSQRPVYIPLTFTLLAAGQVSPFSVDTPLLNYDVIITGAITDAATDRNIALKVPYQERTSFVTVGENRTMYLRFSDLAGGSAGAVNGQKGILYFTTPIIIERQTRLTLDVYKTDVTAADEKINIVLIGHRVSRQYQIGDDQKPLIERYLNLRKMPRQVFLKQKINFDAAGAGGNAKNVYFPPVDEPLIIRGCRTQLENSLVTQIKLEGESDWNEADLPIWALASHVQNEEDSYCWFQRSIFLPANSTIEMSLKNSIDGANIDPQNDNEFTWICETI